jgi:hypothetical protein
MKYNTSPLVPVAAFALIGGCLAGIFGFLVILMTAIGLGGRMPFVYFQEMNLPVISVALPIVGMILFAAILLGLSGQSEETIKPTVVEGATNQSGIEEKKQEHRLKAA